VAASGRKISVEHYHGLSFTRGERENRILMGVARVG